MKKNIPPQPPCPECEKLAAVSDDSNKIGAFLDWLYSKDFLIAAYQVDSAYHMRESLVPIQRFQGEAGINQLLAEYYEIDLDKVEKERRALLEWLRKVQS